MVRKDFMMGLLSTVLFDLRLLRNGETKIGENRHQKGRTLLALCIVVMCSHYLCASLSEISSE